MNNENENKIMCIEENNDSVMKEDKFQIFLRQGRRNDSKIALTQLSFSRNSIDLTNMLHQQQHKIKEGRRNLISVSSYSSLSKSFMNRSFNEQLSFPIPSLKELENIKNSKIKLPGIVSINEQIRKQASEIDKSMTDVIQSFDALNKSKQNLMESKTKLKTLQKELKDAKESRNQVLRDVYQLRNEIEMTKVQMTETNLDNSTYMTQRVLTCSGTNRLGYANNVTFTSNNDSANDLDHQIEQYENKICKLKTENTAFFENYDLVKGDYLRNEAQNIKLKNAIASLEFNIQNCVKEKANLKLAISKLNNCNIGKK